jgi:hypothetical protein
LALNSSKLPHLALIASASAPLGAPPLPGAMMVQNRLWLAWPPPLLRTAGADVLRHLVDLAAEVFDAHGFPLGPRHRVVQIGDVGVVVLAMMNLHRHGVDVGFQRVVRIGQSR